jgi:lysophospholipase L1-like esterase
MKKEKEYLALGDSYTIGEGLDEKDRFPVVLSLRLRSLGLPFSNPKLIAQTGWTTSELIEAIQKENPHSQYDLVSLCIGVNNQYRGLQAEIFQIEFEELLQQAIGFASGNQKRVVVLSIPDWSGTPFAKDRNQQQICLEIDQYNLVIKRVCEQQKVLLINITDICRQFQSKSAFLVSDGLHYSGKMNQKWVDKIIHQLDLSIYENTL